jgi:hypothetical protein
MKNQSKLLILVQRDNSDKNFDIQRLKYNNHNHTQTLSSFTDSPVHIHFPILRSLSPHSIIINLRIFLSISYSFLFVAG